MHQAGLEATSNRKRVTKCPCSDDMASGAAVRENGTISHLGSRWVALTMHSTFCGTDLYSLGSAALTRAAAFNNPNPKRLLIQYPAAFTFQPGLARRGAYSDVHATRCCTSRHVKSLLWRHRHLSVLLQANKYVTVSYIQMCQVS